MPAVYEQFDAHTKLISAYAVLHEGQYIGRIVFKRPKDGAGRVYCYAHVFGAPMVRGSASGYGYDKHSAACAVAIRKLMNMPGSEFAGDAPVVHAHKWSQAMSNTDSQGFQRCLESAGYAVLNVTA